MDNFFDYDYLNQMNEQRKRDNFNSFMDALGFGDNSEKEKVKNDPEPYQNTLNKYYTEGIFYPDKKKKYQEQVDRLKQLGFKVLRNSVGKHLIRW